MLRSLYSGVTGLKSQQTKMDVISNNIANVGTTGFKSGRVRFQDMISQVEANAQGAVDGGAGGSNAQEVGLGVQVSGIDTVMGGGSLQTTGRALDFGIQNGDNSFFVVSNQHDGQGNMQYTRDGGFYIDENNHLVTASGMRVMGYTGNEDGSDVPIEDENGEPLAVSGIEIALPSEAPDDAELQSYLIDDTGLIIATDGAGETYEIGRIALASFSNPDGLEKAGGNLYNQSENSGVAINGAPGEDGYGQVRSGFLEMSNVDLANEFTEMIVTSRAYQANSRSITTSDEMLQELLSLKR